MFAGELWGDAVPVRQVPRPAFPGGAEVTRWGGGDDEDEFSAVEREDHAWCRVPSILADEHPKTTEPRVERLDLGARLDEPRLVEHAVRWQEEFPVHMSSSVPGLCRLEIGHAVVQPAFPPLVEADDNIGGVLGGRSEPLDHLFDGSRRLRHTALEEVAGQDRFREDHDVGLPGMGGRALASPA